MTDLVVQVEQSLWCVCLRLSVCLNNNVWRKWPTFDLNDVTAGHAGSHWHYLGHIRRSRSQVKVHSHRRKMSTKRSVRPRVRAFHFRNVI